MNSELCHYSPFKAKELNLKILYGSKPLGVPGVKGKPPTIFEEFNLSYKKAKLNNCETTPNCYNNLSSNKKRIYSGNLKSNLERKRGATDNKRVMKVGLDKESSKKKE